MCEKHQGIRVYTACAQSKAIALSHLEGLAVCPMRPVTDNKLIGAQSLAFNSSHL